MSGQNEPKQVDWVDVFTKEGLAPKAKCWHEYEKGKKLIVEYLMEALVDQPVNEYDRAIEILIDYLEVWHAIKEKQIKEGLCLTRYSLKNNLP